MTSKTITFYGKGRDQYGMPTPYYSYLIVESHQTKMGDLYFIASIVAMTEPGPMPSQKHFITDKGMGQAMQLAIDALKAHTQMQTLKINES